MKILIARILMPFLLLAQVGAGMSPGRMLCFAVDCCGSEAVVHHDHHHHGHGGVPHGDHRHATACDEQLALSVEKHCDCHIHIVMPDDAGTSRDRAGERIAGLRLMAAALIDSLPTPLEVAAVEPVEAPPRWCWSTCDQCLARATTRLLI